MNTAKSHIDLMSHGLGKTPDARHNLWDTYNRAGRALITAFDWSWRHVGPTELPVVGNQSYADLPDDFAALIEAWTPSTGLFINLQPVSYRRMGELRADETVGIRAGTLYVYWGAWAPQASKESQPTRRALFYPTPVTDSVPTIQMAYFRAWIDIRQDDDLAVPNIPNEYENLLILMARSMAGHIENQTTGVEDQLIQAEIARLILEDARVQPDFGRMTGGVDLRGSRSRAGYIPNGLAAL